MKTDGIIEGLAKAAATNFKPKEGDYIKDGLLYCGKCHTPKQCEVEIGGRVIKPYCMCRCESENYEREKEEERKAERMRRLDMMRRTGFPDSEMREWTFAHDDGKDAKTMAAMKRYVEKFPQMLENGTGLMLYGNVGSGKSFAAACIANALIENGTPCLMTNFQRIVNKLQNGFAGKQEYIDGLQKFDLLIIDDFAAERRTEYMTEQVTAVIDARYRSKLPLIVTTNINPRDLMSADGIGEQRIYSRIMDMCVPVPFNGQDRRRSDYAARTAAAKELLGL
jgi:DNA replication protein DnaC